MSRRNNSRRRRSYGRRQHELGERRTDHLVRWSADEWEPRAGLHIERIDELKPDEPHGISGA